MAEVPNGKFVWYDLMTPDTGASADFYTKLVGWSTMAWEGAPEGQSYDMWVNGEAPIGGMVKIGDELKKQGVQPHWISYVAVPDTDAAAARAQELGGKVLKQPEDIPTVGRFAVLSDPQGAAFAVFTPAESSPGGAGPAKVGEFSWHELATSDWNAAFEFYHSLFGWEIKEEHDMGEMGMYQIFGRSEDEFPSGGMFNKPPEMPVCAWTYYISVQNVDDAVEKVKQLGGQVLNGPMEVPGGDKVAQCMDPQGAMFALHSSAGN